MKLLQVGHAEPLKAGVHAVAAGLAAVCGIYSVAAWLDRKGRPRGHLAFNAVAYTALVVWEIKHVRAHTRQRVDDRHRAA
jgi:hypothetical protein